MSSPVAVPSGDGDPPTPSSDGDEASKDNTLPKSEVQFAFGPQSWYWIRCGTRWRFVRSQASDWDQLKVNDPYWVAFKHDTGIFIGGYDADGEGRNAHTWNDAHLVRADEVDSFVKTRDAYIKLHDWISDQVNADSENAQQISITVGPKGSYFARCGTAQRTHALPKDLKNALDKSDSHPVTIALGKQGAWIVLFADGSRDWNLRHVYPSLADGGYLKDDKNKPVFVALNPYADNEYFVVAENGGCSYALTRSNEEGQRLHEMTDTYMRSRAIRDGTTFSHGGVINGVPKQVRITPTSSPQESRIEAMLATIRGRTVSVKSRDFVFVGAVAGGTGLLAKLAGLPTIRAVGLAASTGGGATISMWYRDRL